MTIHISRILIGHKIKVCILTAFKCNNSNFNVFEASFCKTNDNFISVGLLQIEIKKMFHYKVNDKIKKYIIEKILVLKTLLNIYFYGCLLLSVICSHYNKENQ